MPKGEGSFQIMITDQIIAGEEAEVLVGASLGQSEKGDGAEARREHRDTDGKPVHASTADEVVLVAALPAQAPESQSDHDGKVGQKDDPVRRAEFGHSPLRA